MGQMQNELRSCRRNQYQQEGKCLAVDMVRLNTGRFVIIARFICSPKKEEYIIPHIYCGLIRQ